MTSLSVGLGGVRAEDDPADVGRACAARRLRNASSVATRRATWRRGLGASGAPARWPTGRVSSGMASARTAARPRSAAHVSAIPAVRTILSNKTTIKLLLLLRVAARGAAAETEAPTLWSASTVAREPSSKRRTSPASLTARRPSATAWCSLHTTASRCRGRSFVVSVVLRTSTRQRAAASVFASASMRSARPSGDTDSSAHRASASNESPTTKPSSIMRPGGRRSARSRAYLAHAARRTSRIAARLGAPPPSEVVAPLLSKYMTTAS
mmetsp:Transcript_1799/g.6950  ORF Transcript_1799/g.6950 Transcript_1799/m.6950 type:complete len:268 (+) Transcript_1799:674-1477(+)